MWQPKESWKQFMTEWDAKEWDERFGPYMTGKEHVFRDVVERYGAPKTIGEFGVRAGYGAIVFLTICPNASYHGWDCMLEADSSVNLSHARQILQPFNAIVHIGNTHDIKDPGIRVDFVHIDGDHSIQGAYQDLLLAKKILNPGGQILMDDFRAPYVNAGLDKWVDAGNSGKMEYYPTINGDLLISEIR